MNAAKFTPGPWSPEFEEAYSVRDPQGGRVAICTNLQGRHGLGGRRDGDEVAANTRLIAAAPDLLKALQSILGRRDTYLTDSDEAIANAAIAKATGEAA